MAIGAMKPIRECGNDVAVGGFDDIFLAAYTNPLLTTVYQPIYEIGKRRCAMLIGIILKRPFPSTPHIFPHHSPDKNHPHTPQPFLTER